MSLSGCYSPADSSVNSVAILARCFTDRLRSPGRFPRSTSDLASPAPRMLPTCDEPYHAAFGDLDLVVVANQVALKGVEEHESPRILY
jgi:hypothetical protein